MKHEEMFQFVPAADLIETEIVPSTNFSYTLATRELLISFSITSMLRGPADSEMVRVTAKNRRVVSLNMFLLRGFLLTIYTKYRGSHVLP